MRKILISIIAAFLVAVFLVPVITSSATQSVTTIKVGVNPQYSVEDPVHGNIFVVNEMSSSVSVISPLTNNVIKTIQLPIYPTPALPIYAAYSAASQEVYVLNSGPSPETITVINTNTLNIATTFTVGRGAQELVYNPATTSVYVPNEKDGTISIINVLLRNVKTISVGLTANPGPLGVAFSSPNVAPSMIYISNYYENSISVLSESGRLVTTIALNNRFSGPWNMVFDSKNSMLYVASFGMSTASLGAVSVINTVTNHLVDTIVVGSQPWAIGLNPVSNLIYAANAGSGSVSIISGATDKVISTVVVGPYPWSATYSPVTHLIYVVNENSHTVSEISDGTTSVQTVVVGVAPCQATFGSMTGLMYVVNELGTQVSSQQYGTVSVIR
jgi:YVTN family beta-propeller protein